jgi:nitrogen fixation/metabolism regulation signal transduction histidine kinase
MIEKSVLRLRTKNYRRVISEAISNIDYNAKLKIIEIEFKDGEVYHYLNAKKSEWNKMIEFADKGKGLGAYINQIFKEPYKTGERKYYRLNAIEER